MDSAFKSVVTVFIIKLRTQPPIVTLYNFDGTFGSKVRRTQQCNKNLLQLLLQLICLKSCWTKNMELSIPFPLLPIL